MRLRKDFAFETTMASRSFAPFLQRCRDRGYEINLLFLWLRSVRLAQARVAKRVRGGGHGIPNSVVRRRYRAGISNFFKLYVPLADNWHVFDNSGDKPKPVAELISGGKIKLHDKRIWRTMERLTR